MGLTQKLGTIPLAIQTDSSNNVGIGGAANASYKLAVTGATLHTDTIRILTGANTSDISYAVGKEMSSNNAAFFGWRFNSGGTPYGFISVFGTTGRFSLMPDGGNVGIGTTSPAEKLDVIGGAVAAGNGTIRTGITYSSLGLIGTFTNHDLGILTNGSERMRITSGGNVGIATSSPAALLTIKGRGGADIIFQMNDESNIRRCFYIPNQYYGYMWAVGVVSNGGKAFSFGNQDGSEVGTIVINSSSVAYNTTSDYRLKEDLKDFDGLSILSKVKFYDFKWKSEDTRTTGVIAHELQEVVPYAVNGEKDAIGKDDNPSYQGVDYSKLIAIMGKAIQELNQKVTALENK